MRGDSGVLSRSWRVTVLPGAISLKSGGFDVADRARCSRSFVICQRYMHI